MSRSVDCFMHVYTLEYGRKSKVSGSFASPLHVHCMVGVNPVRLMDGGVILHCVAVMYQIEWLDKMTTPVRRAMEDWKDM